MWAWGCGCRGGVGVKDVGLGAWVQGWGGVEGWGLGCVGDRVAGQAQISTCTHDCGVVVRTRWAWAAHKCARPTQWERHQGCRRRGLSPTLPRLPQPGPPHARRCAGAPPSPPPPPPAAAASSIKMGVPNSMSERMVPGGTVTRCELSLLFTAAWKASSFSPFSSSAPGTVFYSFNDSLLIHYSCHLQQASCSVGDHICMAERCQQRL